MRLSSAHVERALAQFEAQPIPDNHPVVPQLNELFGDHTFFLGNNGLSIVEPAQAPQQGMKAGQVVNLAAWKDESRTSLAPHPPQPTDVIILLDAEC
jgi:hypothetical protein